MTVRFSTGLRSPFLEGRIEIHTGARPASVDDVPVPDPAVRRALEARPNRGDQRVAAFAQAMAPLSITHLRDGSVKFDVGWQQMVLDPSQMQSLRAMFRASTIDPLVFDMTAADAPEYDAWFKVEPPPRESSTSPGLMTCAPMPRR